MRSTRALPLPRSFRLVSRLVLSGDQVLSLGESDPSFGRERFGEDEHEEEHADVEEGGEVKDREDVVVVELDESGSEQRSDSLRPQERMR